MSLIPTIGLPKGRAGQFIVDGVADGYEAFALVQAALEIAPDKPVLFVARDGQRLPAIIEALAVAAPGLPVLELPALRPRLARFGCRRQAARRLDGDDRPGKEAAPRRHPHHGQCPATAHS